VEFDPIRTRRRRAPVGCGSRRRIVESGFFRGTIELHGERGFTTVDLQSARGQVVHSSRADCDKGPSGSKRSTAADDGAQGALPSTVVSAGPRNGSLFLLAGLLEFNSGTTGTFVSVGHTTFREGMTVTNGVAVKGEPDDFVGPGPGDPKVAELTPPAPFEGSARFELTSPKTSTWKGDLAVELPGIGRTKLAGPSFESTLCQRSRCTNTAPGNVGFVAEVFASIFG
jgi:hypothetical protein